MTICIDCLNFKIQNCAVQSRIHFINVCCMKEEAELPIPCQNSATGKALISTEHTMCTTSLK